MQLFLCDPQFLIPNSKTCDLRSFLLHFCCTPFVIIILYLFLKKTFYKEKKLWYKGNEKQT